MSKKFRGMVSLVFVFTLVVAASAVAQVPSANSQPVTVIRAGTLIDGKSDRRREDTTPTF